MNRLLPSLPPALLPLIVACNVDTQDTTVTGVVLPSEPVTGAPAAAARDPRGLIVVGTDYQSTAVSLVSVRGEVQSPLLVASSSAATGLSAPLSGDVVVPTAALPGDEVVLIDRLPASVLTWVDLESAAVRAQLNVGTGFSANPQDYVPVASDKAYVPRFERNSGAGREPFDAGDDVLIIDPSLPAIIGRIELAPALAGADPRFLPRATRGLVAAGRAHLLASPATADFGEFLPSRLVSIDPSSDSIESVLELEGLVNCQSLALAPSGLELAIGCSGAFGQDPARGFPDAGIALVDVSGPPRLARRFAAAELGGAQVGALAHAGASRLVFTSYGRYSSDGATLEAPDALRLLDLGGGALDPLLLAQSSSSAFSLGDVRCALEAATCVLADAETDGGVLRVFDVPADGPVTEAGSLPPNPDVGLPPRYLGAY